MDLGIKDRKAIVCASSKGLGKACAKALMQEGVTVVINARNDENLTETYKELAKIDKNKISMVVADLNTEEGRDSIVMNLLRANANPIIRNRKEIFHQH